MKATASRVERVVNDRWLRYLMVLSAYFFLVLILLIVGERNLVVSQSLFLLSVLLLVIRVIFLIATKSKEPKLLRANLPATIIINNALISIGYLALLAIILTNDYELIWLIYGSISLISVIAIISLMTLLFALNKSGNAND